MTIFKTIPPGNKADFIEITLSQRASSAVTKLAVVTAWSTPSTIDLNQLFCTPRRKNGISSVTIKGLATSSRNRGCSAQERQKSLLMSQLCLFSVKTCAPTPLQTPPCLKEGARTQILQVRKLTSSQRWTNPSSSHHLGLTEENAAANLLEIVNIQFNLRGDKKTNKRHFFERLLVTLQQKTIPC